MEDKQSNPPLLQHRRIRHFTGVNRIRGMPQKPGIVAAWGERGNVQAGSEGSWHITSYDCNVTIFLFSDT